jgi:subtilisin family serine protease
MHFRLALAVALCAPTVAAQELIELPESQRARGRERERMRADIVAARQAGLPPRAAVFALSRDAAGAMTADVFLQAAPGVEARVEALGGSIRTRVGEWMTARVPLAALREISQLPGVRRVSIADRLHPLATTMTEIRATSVRRRVDRDEFEGATGQGTIFGIVDTGIDFRHGDFIDDVTGQSRIL